MTSARGESVLLGFGQPVIGIGGSTAESCTTAERTYGVQKMSLTNRTSTLPLQLLRNILLAHRKASPAPEETYTLPGWGVTPVAGATS